MPQKHCYRQNPWPKQNIQLHSKKHAFLVPHPPLFIFSTLLQKMTNTSFLENQHHHPLLQKKKSHYYTSLLNYRSIAMANTIYKLFTSTLTSILSAYGETHQILYDSQEGFRAKRCTSRQLQLLFGALEDAKFENQDIYLL
jgi:hypothetical protein